VAVVRQVCVVKGHGGVRRILLISVLGSVPEETGPVTKAAKPLDRKTQKIVRLKPVLVAELSADHMKRRSVPTWLPAHPLADGQVAAGLQDGSDPSLKPSILH
jgi:hypothetical protein